MPIKGRRERFTNAFRQRTACRADRALRPMYTDKPTLWDTPAQRCAGCPWIWIKQGLFSIPKTPEKVQKKQFNHQKWRESAWQRHFI